MIEGYIRIGLVVKGFIRMRNLTIIITTLTVSSLVICLLPTGIVVHGEVPIFDGLTNAAQKLENSGETGISPINYSSPTLKDPSLKVEKVVGGLNFSTSMAFLGPNDMIVLEKAKGTVQRIINGTMQNESLLDVPVNYKGGRGMLGVTVASHKNSGSTFIYLYFTQSSTPKDSKKLTEESGNRLYRYELKNNHLGDPKLLLNISAVSSKLDGGHNGGKLLLGPDQNLYLIVGDLREHRTKAQNNQTGPAPDGTSVIYRITQDGDPAPGNPFGNNALINKFFAYGIRNSFGMDFDPLTGKLWDTENGPNYGDEINLVEPGFNSGWKRQQGFLVNPSYPDDFVNIGESGKPGKYSDPEFVWNQPVAPTALKFLTSDKLGIQYKNDMFVADAVNGNIYHFDLKKNRTSLAIYTPLADKTANSLEELKRIIFGRGFGLITDMAVGPDGYMYILTNTGDQGAVFRIVPVSKL
jgi:glucose/arabinose dehydrogenase